MDYKDFTIVLPTLNEERSIGILMTSMLKQYKGISIIVVDDGSTDKTAKIVSSASKSNKRIVFIDRKRANRERGLTASVIEGIIAAKTKFAVVMDADLQHPVDVVGKMVEKLASGDQLVVATRADVKGWELHRKLISKSLITVGYIMLVLGSRGRSRDIFSGFFGVDRKLFIRVYEANPKRFVGGGYKVLYDFLKCIRNRSIRIGEVPYSFGLRQYGSSKAGFKQGMLLFKSFST